MNENAQLFSLMSSNHCGCGAKLGPWQLHDLLSQITLSSPVNMHISSLSNWEDVGAIEWKGNLILQNVDLITPVCDDPYTFGRICAANALSDIYAKGAKALFAMNILCFPFSNSRIDLAKSILSGGAALLATDGVPLMGGHTIDDLETKYGLAVVGYSDKGSFITNSDVKLGDCLILTKPLGSGIIVNAMKNASELVPKEIGEQCLDSMATTNKVASEIMTNYMVNACTDITGFGLAGHLAEMITPGNFSALIDFANIPYFDGCPELLEKGIFSPALHRNQDYLQLLKNQIVFRRRQHTIHSILFDPQTSGGLLISIEESDVDSILNELRQAGLNGQMIGRIVDRDTKPRIIIN